MKDKLIQKHPWHCGQRLPSAHVDEQQALSALTV